MNEMIVLTHSYEWNNCRRVPSISQVRKTRWKYHPPAVSSYRLLHISLQLDKDKSKFASNEAEEKTFDEKIKNVLCNVFKKVTFVSDNTVKIQEIMLNKVENFKFIINEDCLLYFTAHLDCGQLS